MKNKKTIEEYFGTQRPSFAGGAGRNSYQGADLGAHSKGSLGTRGADSKFSQRMQFAVPNDYYDLLEDEEEEEIDEDYIVKDSKYSLAEALALNEIVISSLVDLGADALAQAVAGVTSGFSSIGLVGFNIFQLKGDIEKADVAIEGHIKNPSDETVKEMSDALNSMSINVVDLFQRALESIPDPSPVGEGVSFLVTITQNIQRIAAAAKKSLVWTGLSSKPGDKAFSSASFWGKLKVVGVVVPMLKFFIKLLDSEYTPESVRNNKDALLSVPKRMILLSDLIEDYEVQKEAAERFGYNFKYVNRVLKGPVDAYDFSNSAMRLPEEERPPFRSDPSAAPMASPSPGFESNVAPDTGFDFGNALRKLFVTLPGDSASPAFAESLEHRSMAYLLEGYDADVDEEDLIISDTEEDDADESIEEFSGVGAIGISPALPLGASTKGPGGKKSGDHGGKAFPYTKDTQNKFYKYSRKTFGRK